tara:strand:- start:9351 stop:10037 length:687 start_codon:yes stop_codon:yes gene_type:complete
MDKKGKNNKLKEKINEILSSENTDVLKELIELEKKHPKDVSLKQVISRLYQTAGDNKNARIFLERALKLEPENFATHYNLGLLYKSFKKEEECINHLIKSITYKPDFLEGYNAIGSLFYEKRKFIDAKGYFQKSVEIDNTMKNMQAIIQLALSSYQIFHYTKNLNELKNAINLYELANKLDNENTIIADQLIRLYNRAGLKEDAIILSRKINGAFIYDYKTKKVFISN